jgi:hypothetical protein
MSKIDVKFGEWVQKGFDLYKENFVLLLVVNLLAILFGTFTFFILTGPMYVGVILITLALVDKKEPKPNIGDVFHGFTMFLPSFLFVLVFGFMLGLLCLILSFIPCVGQVLNIVLSFAAGTLLMFGLFLIADKKMDFWPAALASYEKVKDNFWPFLALCVVASLISSIGTVVCCVGVIVTAPLYVAILAVAYREIFTDQPASVPVAPQAPVAPPPAS